MIIGYKKRFVPKILDGTKKHTLREDIHDRWHAGKAMHQSTGIRTKQYKCFKMDKCISTQKIEIKHETQYSVSYVKIYIDNMCVGTHLNGYPSGLIRLIAKNDGFDNVEDFFKWFNKDFSGKIIHWTDLRY